MGTVLDSIDGMIASVSAKQPLNRFFMDTIGAAGTAANITSGFTSAGRFPNPFTMPSVGSGVNGAYFNIDMLTEDASTILMAAIEYTLGTLTVSGNSYSDGVAMPTKTIRIDGQDYSQQTSSVIPMVVITGTLTATTPTLTITYTDQDGNTGSSATMTLPTNAAVNSAYCVAPHLATGDSGIMNLSASGPSGLSISTGTGGTIKLMGLLPLAFNYGGVSAQAQPYDIFNAPFPKFLVAAGETIAFYRFGSVTTCQLAAHLYGLADY